MKFVYFGYDFMIDSVHRLMADGHELIGVFSFECDNIFNFNTQTEAVAQQLDIPFSQKQPTDADINAFIEKGCALFLCAGYIYKIPPIDENKARGINVHPSYLPKGRGIMPTPYIIIDTPEAAGFTAHKLSEKFDQGDIIDQHRFDLSDHETVETYSARIAMASPEFLSRILSDFDYYWKKAKPQNENTASFFPAPSDQMRLLNFDQPIEDIDKIARAFGRYGSLAQIEGNLFVVYDHDIWQENHELEPGTIACRLSREIVIAAQNGFVCLKDFHPVQTGG